MTNQSSLTDLDRELLDKIQSQFDAVEQLVEAESMNWHWFQTYSCYEQVDESPANSRRNLFIDHFTRETRNENR